MKLMKNTENKEGEIMAPELFLFLLQGIVQDTGLTPS